MDSSITCFFLNLGDGRYINTAFLFELAFEFDARGVISADFDADGRQDLLVVENIKRPKGLHQVVHLLANRVETSHHWLGFILTDGKDKPHPMNARMTLKTPTGIQVKQLVSGDSLYSQHPPVFHFGLGASDQVEWVEIQYADGTKRRIPNPEIDRYHRF